MKNPAAFSVLVAFAFAVLGAHPAMSNMVSLWFTTDTYMHGAAILPLSFYLFKKMQTPNTLPSSLNLPSSLSLAALWGAAYYIGLLSGVNLLQQVIVIGLIPMLFLSIFGWRYLWHYRTPLILIFLCVPVGDFLIPYLQTFTADMSVKMLKMSGVTVVHNGWYIRIAAADFRVAEACSGINFLISTFAASCFYAFLFMTKAYKRALFIALGIVVPVLANGVRVYLIIMVAELGNIEAATGVDHLIYGWIFFVIVLIMLFTIGHYMQDPEPTQKEDGMIIPWCEQVKSSAFNITHALIAFVVLSYVAKNALEDTVYLPIKENDGYSERDARSKLNPSFPHADTSQHLNYEGWEVHRFAYNNENATKKVVGYENHLFDKERWSIKEKSTVSIEETLPVRVLTVIDASGTEGTLLVTYCSNGAFEATPLALKQQQLLQRLKHHRDGGVATLYFKLGLHDASSIPLEAFTHTCKRIEKD